MLVRSFNRILDNIYNNRWSRSIFYFLMIVYLIVFIILFSIYGLNAIGIHTNLFIPISIIAVCNYFIKKDISKKLFDNIKYITSIYFIIEFFLIIICPEKIDRNFFFQYNSEKVNSYYRIRKPNHRYRIRQKEFNFERKSNSIGLSEIEIPKSKEIGKIRIICIGDSFTEGDGTHKDSTYVKFLERRIEKEDQNVEFFNAGRCGSDPFFDFELLKDILIEYQPDMIIQSFTSNDFYHDLPMRGGKERFMPNHNLKYKNDHWWEPIYASSYTARILIQSIGGYDKYLIKTKDRPFIENEMKNKTLELFEEYQKYLSKNNSDLILFTLPFKQDLGSKSHNKIFYDIFNKDLSQNGVEFYNLEDCYKNHISKNNTLVQDYYWMEDGHHNAKGYEMMADCLYEILIMHLNDRR